MNLKQLQSDFYQAIAGNKPDSLIQAVIPGGELSTTEAVAVYQDGYPARLTESLGDTYETVWRILGDKEFFSACKDYIKNKPSLSHNLSDYGLDFGEFIAARYSDFDFLEELTDFEWQFKELFHQKEEELPVVPMSEQGQGAKVPVLRLVAQTRLFQFKSRISVLWQHRNSPTDAPPPDYQGQENLLLCKNDGLLFFRELSQADFYLVSSFREPINVDTAIESALDAGFEYEADDLQQLFIFLGSNNLLIAADES